MAPFTIDNLDDSTREALMELARRHGRSIEEEARDILRAAVSSKPADDQENALGSRISNRFRDCGLSNDDRIDEWRADLPQPADFD